MRLTRNLVSLLFLCLIKIRLLTQSFNITIDDVNILSMRFFRQSWHTHNISHDNNNHLRAIVDDNVAHVKVEVLRDAVSLWVCRE